jgi:hypothetical protein
MLAKMQRWWRIKAAQYDVPWQQDGQFWGVSLFVHLVLLFMLARLIFPTSSAVDVRITANADDRFEIIELPPEVQFDEMQFTDVGAESQELNDLAEPEASLFEELNDTPFELSIPTMIMGDQVMEQEFLNASPDNVTFLKATGSVGVSLSNAAGAVDRLTEEILLSLKERKTMVVWLFDESASLITQRQEIRGRIDKIYRELNAMAGNGREEFTKHGDKPLLSMVYGFGSNLHRMLPDPSDDTDVLLDAIDRIKRDESGLEYVFSAVIQAATDFKKLRRINHLTNDRERNVMIIVVSDEAGDDIARLDEAIKVCTNLQVPVHVVGVPAPFGREETLVRWVDPDPNYDQEAQWAVVSQGPESMMSEMVKLDFEENDFVDLQMIDSGFGPFGLTRLAYETGGIYFAVHPNRRVGRSVSQQNTENYSAYLQYFFDSNIMRRYKPDYVSQETYMQRLAANRCRMSLVQAATLSQVGSLQAPIRRFPKFNEAAFVNQVNLAQRGAAILEPKINQLYEVLRTGEADRDLELSPRWQAGFDVAYGRVLANKVRVESYNAMLALIKTKLVFQEPEKNNTWVLVPADSIQTGSQAESMAKKARGYLQNVVDQHPGTPWAMLAERELKTPIGWQWQETFTEPPRPPENNPQNNNNNGMAAVPQPMENADVKPRRPPPKL